MSAIPTPGPTLAPTAPWSDYQALSIFTSILATYGLSLAIACTCYICMRRSGPGSRFFRGALNVDSEGTTSQLTPPIFVTKSFSETNAAATNGKEPISCSICLNDFEAQEVTIELDCGHVYHADCLNEWLLISTLCPLCKRVAAAAQLDLVDEEERQLQLAMSRSRSIDEDYNNVHQVGISSAISGDFVPMEESHPTGDGDRNNREEDPSAEDQRDVEVTSISVTYDAEDV